MRRLLVLFLLVCLAPLARADDGAKTPVKVGLIPNLTPLTLIAMYQPLRLHLERTLNRPVELLTAPDFRTFATRTDSGRYDVVLTAPHLAWLAMSDAGYDAIATYDQKLQALLLVSSASSMKNIADLRGAKIAEPDPLAVVGMLGRSILADAGVPPTEVSWVTIHSHNGAALATLAGRTDAAVIGSIPFIQLPEDTRTGLRILASSQVIPNQVWLVNRKLPLAQRQALQDALLAFPATPAGQYFLKSRAYGGIRKLQADELRPMEPYAKAVRQLLGEPQ